VVGSADTGSGKTLAFGLPVLNGILALGDRANRDTRRLSALILSPTRELAMQVSQHLTAAAKHTDIKVVPVVGGISLQKQQRLLSYKPDVVRLNCPGGSAPHSPPCPNAARW